jgi:hypothetical protein
MQLTLESGGKFPFSVFERKRENCVELKFMRCFPEQLTASNFKTWGNREQNLSIKMRPNVPAKRARSIFICGIVIHVMTGEEIAFSASPRLNTY